MLNVKQISCLSAGVMAALFAAGPAPAQKGEETVRVGVLTDMAGTYSAVAGAGSVLAARMAIEDFGGKVLGKPIALVSADHQQKADVASAIARKWFDTEGVDIALDLPNSVISLAVQNIAREKKRISVITTGGTEVATNAQCSPTGMHWVYDSYSLGKTLATALTKPGDKWYFVVMDNVAGDALQKGIERFLPPTGGSVAGGVRHPLNTPDMSSFLLQAQNSGAKYIALGNGGSDLITSVKQASEFGIVAGGQKLVGIAMFLTDLKAIGLDLGQGMIYATGFYPAQSEQAQAWSKRFFDRHGAMPNDSQAGVYSALLHYLKAVEAAGTKDSEKVMAKMRELPVNDMFTTGGRVRADGRMVHDTFLVQAKTPKESTGPWDLVKSVATIPGDQAFRPLAESECPLVKTAK